MAEFIEVHGKFRSIAQLATWYAIVFCISLATVSPVNAVEFVRSPSRTAICNHGRAVAAIKTIAGRDEREALKREREPYAALFSCTPVPLKKVNEAALAARATLASWANLSRSCLQIAAFPLFHYAAVHALNFPEVSPFRSLAMKPLHFQVAQHFPWAKNLVCQIRSPKPRGIKAFLGTDRFSIVKRLRKLPSADLARGRLALSIVTNSMSCHGAILQ